MENSFERKEPRPPIAATASQLEPRIISGRDCNVTVFPLTKDWIDEIVSIERRSFSSPWSRELILRTLEQKFSFSPGMLNQDGRLVGYSFNYIVVDELHVLNLAVHPAYRNRALGRALLTYVLSFAAANDVSFATLEVRVSNVTAKRLYTSMGFKLAGVRARYYRDNGEDALILEKEITTQDRAASRAFNHQ